MGALDPNQALRFRRAFCKERDRLRIRNEDVGRAIEDSYGYKGDGKRLVDNQLLRGRVLTARWARRLVVALSCCLRARNDSECQQVSYKLLVLLAKIGALTLEPPATTPAVFVAPRHIEGFVQSLVQEAAHVSGVGPRTTRSLARVFESYLRRDGSAMAYAWQREAAARPPEGLTRKQVQKVVLALGIAAYGDEPYTTEDESDLRPLLTAPNGTQIYETALVAADLTKGTNIFPRVRIPGEQL